MPLIQVNQLLAATDLDVLAGTQLDQVPRPGVFRVWAASTVGDSTMSVTLGADTLINGQVLPLRANGVPDIDADVPILVPSPGGVRPVVSVTEVTAMTAMVIVVFQPA